METKQIAKIKNKIFAITLIVVLQAVGFAYAYRSTNQANALKNKQINSLIAEVGDLRSENDFLNLKISQYESFQSITADTFRIFQEKIDETTRMSTIIKTDDIDDQNELIEENLSLQKSLAQKQTELKNLKTDQQVSSALDELNESLDVYLILGINKELTDTIMLAAVNPTDEQINLLSIPRDLSYEGRKINEYYAKYGIKSLRNALQEITGLNIENYVVVDFQAFKDLVDFVGGVDINIEKTLVDYLYPTPSGGYQTITFKAGITRMDGDTALIYARSRKSTSDYDRAKRQQQIIIALREKIKSTGLIDNVALIKEGFEQLNNNISTDISLLKALDAFTKYSKYSISAGNVISPDNFLYESYNTAGQFVLLPADGSFSALKKSLIQSL